MTASARPAAPRHARRAFVAVGASLAAAGLAVARRPSRSTTRPRAPTPRRRCPSWCSRTRRPGWSPPSTTAGAAGVDGRARRAADRRTAGASSPSRSAPTPAGGDDRAPAARPRLSQLEGAEALDREVGVALGLALDATSRSSTRTGSQRCWQPLGPTRGRPAGTTSPTPTARSSPRPGAQTLDAGRLRPC